MVDSSVSVIVAQLPATVTTRADPGMERRMVFVPFVKMIASTLPGREEVSALLRFVNEPPTVVFVAMLAEGFPVASFVNQRVTPI